MADRGSIATIPDLMITGAAVITPRVPTPLGRVVLTAPLTLAPTVTPPTLPPDIQVVRLPKRPRHPRIR